jgi:hypothetical protein
MPNPRLPKNRSTDLAITSGREPHPFLLENPEVKVNTIKRIAP